MPDQTSTESESADKHLLANRQEGLDKLRHKFFKRLRRDVISWGGEMLDLAWTYYPRQETQRQEEPKSEVSHQQSDDGRSEDVDTPRLVVDRVNLPHLRCSSFDFMDSVQRDWWPNRAKVKTDEETAEVEAIVGFYGRYLGASGYALVMEFTPQHAQDFTLKPTLWRVDARPEGVKITFPQDEGEVYSQLGAYLDLQEGWAWLARESIKAEALITAEVEPGYLIGVRPGDPMSELPPSEREDPEIEEVFSRFDAERFDTLEFLNSEESESYPFESERYPTWLPVDVVNALQEGKSEAFVLSQSNRFFEAIEEVAERRKVEVSLEGDDHPTLIFSRGPLSLRRQFSLPYLWTLHSGRQHHEGAVEYFRDDLVRLFEASEVFFQVRRILSDAHGPKALSIEVTEGDLLTIKENQGEGKTWIKISLFEWVTEGVFEGREGALRFLQLFGWTSSPPQWRAPTHALDRCPLCDKDARLHKMVRPLIERSTAQPHKRVGHLVKERLPEHVEAHYALICPQHRTPVFWSNREAVHQAYEVQTHQILEVSSAQSVDLSGLKVELLWGEELAGALLNENNRETLRERGALYACAVTPDLVLLSLLPMNDELRARIEPKCAQMIAQFGPDRDWRLDWTIELR